MDVYLLRHGKAVDRRAWLPRRDRSRPLTKSGIRTMRRVARGLRALNVRVDLILSSPLCRARQTAEIVAAELGIPVLEVTRHLEPGAEPDRLVSFLERRAGGAGVIVLVGHEPGLSSLVSMLLGGGGRMAMKKGGLCKVRIDRLRRGRRAILEWLLTPRHLAGMR